MERCAHPPPPVAAPALRAYALLPAATPRMMALRAARTARTRQRGGGLDCREFRAFSSMRIQTELLCGATLVAITV